MKKIALINDISGFGRCSLTAAIPVVSVMGIQACPLPTAVLSAQTDFGEYFCHDLTDKMNHITDGWKQMDAHFDGIHSGYLADAAQIGNVQYFLEQFRSEDTIYLADPVMGDHGRTYDMFSAEFLKGMKQLTLQADVITPNLTELCMLADVDYQEMITHRQDADYLDRIKEICRRLLAGAHRKQTVIVTGIIRNQGEEVCIGNLAVTETEDFHIEHPYTGVGFSGTGDLFASVICGSLVKGLSVRDAMEKATFFLREAIEEASAVGQDPCHGVYFEKYLPRLL